MKKNFRKILFTIICFMLIPSIVSAASANISVSSSSTVAVGNTVTVTVKLSSSTKIGAWDMILSYDSSYLQLTSSTSENGGTKMANSSAGTTSKTYTYKFKTLKTGSTKISVPSYDILAVDQSNMSVSSSSKTISIKTQSEIEASYSKNNDLKSLSVDGYEVTPVFSSDVLEYSVDVPENTTEININATKEDSTATVTGAGVVAVTPGNNIFDIVVKAQNGTEKIYKLTVNVIDSNPINIETEAGNKSVVKIKEYLTLPHAFTETTVKIGEFDIPAFYNEVLDYTVVGLKDEEGNISYYIYDIENDTYKPYYEMKFLGLVIVPIETDKTIDGYKEYDITVNDNEYKGLKLSKDSKFAIIYGKNVETGEEGFYKYDIENNSLIKYDDEHINMLSDKITLYTYIIIGFAGILVILFIIIIKMNKGKTKPKKEKKRKKKLEEDDD